MSVHVELQKRNFTVCVIFDIKMKGKYMLAL